MTEAIYFGRFQPPLLKHGEIILQLLAQKNIHLTIGIAHLQGQRTRENFLYGDELTTLFQRTLDHLEIKRATPTLVTIDPERPFKKSLEDFLTTINHRGKPMQIFSGSTPTIRTCTELTDKFKLAIISLMDDDETGPRARQVREGLYTQDYDSWKGLVAPTVYEFLCDPKISRRLQEAPNGQKRPWVSA